MFHREIRTMCIKNSIHVGKGTTHSIQKRFLRKIIKDQILNLIKEQLATPIRFEPLLNQYAEYRYKIVNLI